MDELTDDQTTELIGLLQGLQTSLEQHLANASDRTDTVDLDQPIGRLSRVDALQQQAMAKEQLRRNRIKLSQVKQALVAAADDEYGLCRSCEESIGYRRLKAFPEAPFCISCRAALERR
jgi:DnaK suppressor protein